MLLFIAIFATTLCKLRYSNTSHVIIYLENPTYKTTGGYHSNTSHVIIYRAFGRDTKKDIGIQIHLMLLFINGVSIVWIEECSFKYISCYYLSMMVQR